MRKLIDEYLISLGINPKIPPVELLSPKFIQEVEKNTSPKAKASEMEHAVRKHCKIHFEEDPAFYTKLSKKLEALIHKHMEDWNELAKELFSLRGEAEAGRQEEIEGVSAQAAPFYDLIGQLAFGNGVPEDHVGAVKDLIVQVIGQLRETIGIINFWSNGPEVHTLRGKLSDLMLFSGIDEIADNSDTLVTEIAALAKKRHEDLVR